MVEDVQSVATFTTISTPWARVRYNPIATSIFSLISHRFSYVLALSYSPSFDFRSLATGTAEVNPSLSS